jgi:hypothetical protein
VTVNNITAGTIASNQTICSGGDPAAFTVPVAAVGTGSLTYQWQKSTTDCNSGFTDLAGGTSATYDAPAGLLATAYYRRIDTSTVNGVKCTAITNCVTVTINNVTGGTVAKDTAICSGGNPNPFTETVAATGSGTLSYQWQSNITGCGGTWANISGAMSATYDVPAGLAVTTYYRRVTTSTLNGGTCSANSNCITVSVNSLPSTPSVCFILPSLCSTGTTTGTVSFTPIAGGQYSIDNGANYYDCPVFTGLNPGGVTGLKIKNSAGCVSAADCNSITTCASVPTPCPSTITRASNTSEITLESEPTVKAYPNPFSDRIKFVVTSPVAGKGNLEVYNMMGQKVKTVYQGYIVAGHQTFELSLPTQQIANLVYVLRVGDKKVSGKILQINQ